MTKKRFLIFIILFSLFCPGYAQSIGGATTGATTYCTSDNAGFISLTGYNGNILFWESSINNGSTWNNIGNQTSTQSYFNLIQTTLYRAIVKDGALPTDTSTITEITIFQAAIAGTLMGGNAFCLNSGTGTLTLTGFTGTPQYWQYSLNNGLSWTVIQNTLAVLNYSSTNQNINYRAIVSNIAGCPFDTSSVATIKIDQNTIAGSLSGTDSVCFASKNNTITLVNYFGNILDWQKSLGNSNVWTSLTHTNDSITISEAKETYSYRTIIKNGSCSTLTTTPFTLNVFAVNFANAGPDQTIDQYQAVTLNGSGNGTPQWIQANVLLFNNTFNPVVTPEITSTYILKLIDAHDCISYDTVNVNVNIPVPNAITPNSDGMNDSFVIDKIGDFENNTLQIFNKWGTLVYSAAPYKNEFTGVSSSGKELPDEIYYYIFNYGNGDKPLKNYILIKR